MEFINPIFEFSRAMNELQLNDAEFALLIAISIFSAGVRRGRREREQETCTKRGLQAPRGRNCGGGSPCRATLGDVGCGMSLFWGL